MEHDPGEEAARIQVLQRDGEGGAHGTLGLVPCRGRHPGPWMDGSRARAGRASRFGAAGPSVIVPADGRRRVIGLPARLQTSG